MIGRSMVSTIALLAAQEIVEPKIELWCALLDALTDLTPKRGCPRN